MPSGLVSAYAKALPVLQAEDIMNLVQAVAAGTGNLEKDDQREYMRSLQRQANVKARKMNQGDLAKMGISEGGDSVG